MSRINRLLTALVIVAPLAACDVPFTGPDPGDTLADLATTLESDELDDVPKEIQKILAGL